MTPADPLDREILAILGQYADDREVREAALRLSRATRRARNRAHRRQTLGQAVAGWIGAVGLFAALGYLATLVLLLIWKGLGG